MGASSTGGQQLNMVHTGTEKPRPLVVNISNKTDRYHGHAEGQIQDGLYGPIVIRYVLRIFCPPRLVLTNTIQDRIQMNHRHLIPLRTVALA